MLQEILEKSHGFSVLSVHAELGGNCRLMGCDDRGSCTFDDHCVVHPNDAQCRLVQVQRVRVPSVASIRHEFLSQTRTQIVTDHRLAYVALGVRHFKYRQNRLVFLYFLNHHRCSLDNLAVVPQSVDPMQAYISASLPLASV